MSASTDGTATVWTTDGTIVRTLKHPYGVTAADFSPDGKSIATTSYDGTLRIWNLEDGALSRTITHGANTLWCLAFSLDGMTLATGSFDRTAILWDVADGSLLRVLAGHEYGAEFSRDGKWLLIAGKDRPMLGELLQNVFGDSDANKWVTAQLLDIERKACLTETWCGSSLPAIFGLPFLGEQLHEE